MDAYQQYQHIQDQIRSEEILNQLLPDFLEAIEDGAELEDVWQAIFDRHHLSPDDLSNFDRKRLTERIEEKSRISRWKFYK